MNGQIIIIGFMGAGKSAVARALASSLSDPIVDLDELITKNEGRSPAAIIEQDGENSFRQIETETLREVVTTGAARIVALGGGAWTIAENRELLTSHGAFTVWLDVPFELCWRRIEAGHAARPLAPSRELAEKLYYDRRGSYALAQARIAIGENDSAEAIAAKLAAELSHHDTNNHEKAETL
ncbi:MAG TPA: shikimate kinase [Pyrinomonadaceae bacterium]|nr:shikimate kinase [Pyrinomonadaceae bacterium]